MTLITFSDGKVVMRDGKVGTEQACCCGCPSCISLWMFPDTAFTGEWFDPQAYYDDAAKPWYDAMQANLEAAGWTVTREVVICVGNCAELFGEGVPPNGLYVGLSATCECCIENITQCDYSLSDQPEGMWAQVIPVDVPVPYVGVNGLFYFRPTCLAGDSCIVPGYINGAGLDDPFPGAWVPVCDPDAEYCNPLP